MRVAILSEYFYPDNSGGTPTDLSEFGRFLKQHYPAITIEVVTSRNLYRFSGVQVKLPVHEVWQGVGITRLRTPRSNRPSMALRMMAGGLFSCVALVHLLFRKRYDLLLIVTNPPANGMAAWFYRKLRGVPYVYLVHDLYPDIAVALGGINRQSAVVRLFSLLQKRWLNAASRVVVLGRCMQRYLMQHYAVPLARLSVIPSWADPDAIQVSSCENGFRKEHGLTGFVVLYAGNFSRYVNLDQMIAAARLLPADAQVMIVLVGDGARKQEILDRIKAEGLTNVRVLPKVPRSAMGEVLAAANASMIPLDSRMLGLGVPSKLYSTLGAGRPVLALVPEESEVARVVAEEECGLRVPDGDAAALAKAILRLQQDPVLAKQMGLNARRALENRFTLRHAAEKFHALFEEVVAGHQK